MNFLKNLTIEKIAGLLTLVVFFGFAIYAGVSSYIKKRKCPKCKSFIRTKTVSKGSLGENFGSSFHQDFRIFYKCGKCEHIWNIIDTEIYDVD